jgi:hypothetical protein
MFLFCGKLDRISQRKFLGLNLKNGSCNIWVLKNGWNLCGIHQLQEKGLFTDDKIELGALGEKQKGGVLILKLKLGRRKRAWRRNTEK